MPRIPTASVTDQLLHDITDEFDIMDKIRDRRLTTEEGGLGHQPAIRFYQKLTRILKHYTREVSPRHIATSHQTVGTPEQHWHVRFRLPGGQTVRPQVVGIESHYPMSRAGPPSPVIPGLNLISQKGAGSRGCSVSRKARFGRNSGSTLRRQRSWVRIPPSAPFSVLD